MSAGQVISVIQTALPVLLTLALGMLCRSRSFLSREGVDTLKKVVVNLTLPFVLFNAFAAAEYSLSAMVQPGIIFVCCTVMLGLGFLLVRVTKTEGRLAPFLASGFEAGMLGFPLFAMLFPKESLSALAIPVLGQELFVFTLYKTLLVGKTSLKAVLKDIFSNPILIAVLLGLVVGATGLYGKLHTWGVGSVVDAVTGFLSAPTGMIILLCVGYDLVPREIPWKKTGGLVAMRLGIAGVMLGALIALNRTVLRGMMFEGALALLFILPPPYIIPVFSDEPDERVQISSALSVLTLMTMILFAALSVLFQR